MSDGWILERRIDCGKGSVQLSYLSTELDEYKIISYDCSNCKGYDKYYSLWGEGGLILDTDLDPTNITKVLCYDCSGQYQGSCVKREYEVYSDPAGTDEIGALRRGDK